MTERQGDGGAWAPLSDSQRTVWVAERLAPGTSVFHESVVWTIDGPLDPDALEAALRAVAVRQPMLRTRFVRAPDGEPRQVVDAEPRVDLERVTLASGDRAAPND